MIISSSYKKYDVVLWLSIQHKEDLSSVLYPLMIGYYLAYTMIQNSEFNLNSIEMGKHFFNQVVYCRFTMTNISMLNNRDSVTYTVYSVWYITYIKNKLEYNLNQKNKKKTKKQKKAFAGIVFLHVRIENVFV